MTDSAATPGAPTSHGSLPQRGSRLWVQRLVTVGVVGAAAAAAAFVLRFNPTDRVADPTGPCLWHAVTGINGPACGGTRMFYYLLHGDLLQAARHHLVALMAVPFLIYAFIGWAARVWFGVTIPRLRLTPWIYLSYAALWLVFAVVLRSLPWLPFTWFDIPNLDQ